MQISLLLLPPITNDTSSDIEIYNFDSQDSAKFDEFDEFSLECSAPQMEGKDKVKLLMTKISASFFSEYSKSVLPKQVIDFNYKETIENLHKLVFGYHSIFMIDMRHCEFVEKRMRILDVSLID